MSPLNTFLVAFGHCQVPGIDAIIFLFLRLSLLETKYHVTFEMKMTSMVSHLAIET